MKSLYSFSSKVTQFLRHIRRRVKVNIFIVVNRIDDRRIGAHGFEQRLAM